MWLNMLKKVKALIDKPLDELGLRHVRLAMAKVKCPCKLDISVLYQLTRRLPHEGLDYYDAKFIDPLLRYFLQWKHKVIRTHC